MAQATFGGDTGVGFDLNAVTLAVLLAVILGYAVVYRIGHRDGQRSVERGSAPRFGQARFSEGLERKVLNGQNDEVHQMAVRLADLEERVR